jgi:hypothetical protein
VLKSLENPNLNGILLGLNVSDFQLTLRHDLFPCCTGEGLFESGAAGRTPPAAVIGHTHRCALRRRFRNTEAVYRQYYQLWGLKAQPPHLLRGDHSAKILRHVADTLKGYRPQAAMLHSKAGQPSDIWPMALACTWRFGIDVHLIRPQKNLAAILPPKSKTDGPLAIFLENVDRLWEPQNAEIVESLVNFAYHANAFLWINTVKPKAVATSGNQRQVSAMIQNRLQKEKNRSPFEFLDPECVSRLESLCALPRTSFDGVGLL